jgi:hypothetical protein
VLSSDDDVIQAIDHFQTAIIGGIRALANRMEHRFERIEVCLDRLEAA